MNIQNEINLINDIILNAVIHGADSGGSCNSNEDGFRQAINAWGYRKESCWLYNSRSRTCLQSS